MTKFIKSALDIGTLGGRCMLQAVKLSTSNDIRTATASGVV